METKESRSGARFDSNLTIPLNKIDRKPEPNIIETKTVITNTEPNEIDIAECDAPNHTNQMVIKTKTPPPIIELIKTEPNEIDIAECDAPNHTNQMVIQTKTPPSIIALSNTESNKIDIAECDAPKYTNQMIIQTKTTPPIIELSNTEPDEINIAECDAPIHTNQMIIQTKTPPSVVGLSNTESNEIDIAECNVPNHTNEMVVQTKAPSPIIKLLGTKNCKITDGRASEETRKTKLSQNDEKLSKMSHKNKRIVHICEICDAIFDRFRILEVHMLNEHGGKAVYNVCRKCEFNFKQPSCLRHHIIRIHLSTKTNKLTYCPHCYKIFNATEQLDAHIKRMHIAIAPGMIYCKECHTRFQSKNKLEHHIKLKHPKNSKQSPRRVKCKLCHRNFEHRYHFKEHYEKIHLNAGSLRKFPCQECTCFFRHRPSLYMHIQNKHCKNESNICPDSFKPLQTLQEHKGNNHERNFICNDCNVSFTLKQNLIDHIRSTHNSPLSQCTGCNATFTSVFALKDHLKTLHPQIRSKYSCHLCDEKFQSYTTFRYHNIQVHNEATICPVCGIEFATRNSLRSHIQVHSRKNYTDITRVFICDLCQTSYTSKFALRGHILSHFLASEFECRVCSQLFRTKGNLISHVKLKHKPTQAWRRESFARSATPELNSDLNRLSANSGRQIKCFKCEETFSQGKLLRKHVTDDHKVIVIFR